MRLCPAAACLLLACVLPAAAGTFKLPDNKPLVSITVPDNWNPNTSEDGVDAAAPDNGWFFSIYVAEEDNANVARREALGALIRNGMKIDEKSGKESPISLAGLAGVQTQFTAREDGKPRIVRTDIAQLSNRRFIQLFQWGPPDGMAKNAAALDRILASLKRTGK